METYHVARIQLCQQRLDSVHETLSRVPYRSWAYTYWSGVYAYLLRRLNTLLNDNNFRERRNFNRFLH